MNRVSVILALVIATVLSGCASQQSAENEGNNRVLLILRESAGSSEKQYMVTDEAIVMKSVLEEAGLEVVIASASGRVFLRANTALKSDLRLDEVHIVDYEGFLIPCMSLGNWTVKPEEVALAKRVVAGGKPVAAQRKGVVILAEAGVLVGRQYSFAIDPDLDARFDGGKYSGDGVVRDGNIITSAYCPYHDAKDQTTELTRLFIAALRE